MKQSNLFGYLYSNYVITKPIRKIEFFAGMSTFAMALRDLEVNYESWKICEWDVNAIASNKAIHHSDDHTDYSADLTKEELQQQLYELGISNDGKSPMKLESIKRKNEQWLRDTYNNIKATKNLVDITKVKGKDLDIVDIDKYCYILSYSFPCQDLSKAGKQLGMAKDSGTRSSMLWQFERIMVELHELGIHPDVLIMENVPDVVGTKNIKHFNDWYAKLETLGYQSYYKNLNAKNYGIPQNRDRCFMVSIYGEYSYDFPKEIPLGLRLKDMLQHSVDEKYYLADNKIQDFLNHFMPTNNENTEQCLKRIGNIYGDDKGTGYAGNVWDVDGVSPTITTFQGGNRQPMIINPVICASRGRNPENPKSRKSGEHTEQMIEVNTSGCSNTLTTVQKDNLVIEPICLNSKVDGKQPSVQDRIYDINAVSTAVTTSYMPSIAIPEATKQGYTLASDGDYVNLAYPESKTRRGRVGKQVAQTLLCNDNNGVVENIRIRKLTPLECWRLMGYTDEDFYKAAGVNSNSQLYKQAGNGIVKQVAMAIFSTMLPSKKAK